MVSKAFSAQGTTISLGNGAQPEVFTVIGEVKSFDGPGGNVAMIDVTTLSSTAREKVAGLQDFGQMTLEINFDPTSLQHQNLAAYAQSGAKHNYKITFSDAGGTTAVFTALVAQFRPSGQVDQIVAARVTLEVSGSVTWTWGA
jgi:hypothetical protein